MYSSIRFCMMNPFGAECQRSISPIETRKNSWVCEVFVMREYCHTGITLAVAGFFGGLVGAAARYLAAAAFLLSAAAHSQTVYKCTSPDGSTTYSQRPCGDDAKEMQTDGRSPYQKADDAKKIWRVLSKGVKGFADVCVENWRPLLKDPESARIDDAGVYITSPKRTILMVAGRAKNSFGGMAPQVFLCESRPDGILGKDWNPYGDLVSQAERVLKYGPSIAFPGLPD